MIEKMKGTYHVQTNLSANRVNFNLDHQIIVQGGAQGGFAKYD